NEVVGRQGHGHGLYGGNSFEAVRFDTIPFIPFTHVALFELTEDKARIDGWLEWTRELEWSLAILIAAELRLLAPHETDALQQARQTVFDRLAALEQYLAPRT